MRTSPAPRTRRKFIALAVSGLVLLALIAVGGYGLLVGAASAPDPTPRDPSSPSTMPPKPESTSQSILPRIVPTNDPETFARSVATVLFTWDTGTGLVPLDYTSTLLAVGDPSGTEQAGLAADIATYLPTHDAWMQLREYGTTQHLTIDRAVVPNAWSDAVAQARPGQLAPGAIAYTIDGVRHRGGVWNGAPQGMSERIAFTVFLACPAHGDPCYLLRFSQLGNPLR